MKETWNRTVTIRGKSIEYKSPVIVVDVNYSEMKSEYGEERAEEYIQPGVYDENTIKRTFAWDLQSFYHEDIDHFPKELLKEEKLMFIIEMVNEKK